MSVQITADDIKVYLSGGDTNDDPNESLGGVKSSHEVVDDNLHNLFARVSAAEADSGSTKYRGIYIANEVSEDLTWVDVVAFIKEQSLSSDTTVEIGVAPEGVDETMEEITDEDTDPSGVTFTDTEDPDQGEVIGDIPQNSYVGIWVKRIVEQNAAAYGDDQAKLGHRGETTTT